MLKFDINYLLKLKGETKKMAYLRHHGISEGRAHQLIRKDRKSISISDIESLCRIFNCTPNDLFTFEESASNPLHESAALRILIRKPLPSVPEIIKDLTVEQATALINQIQSLKPQK